MEQTISQILESQYPSKSPREALESYSHIELTDEEEAAAILEAKIKKERQLERDHLDQMAAENRRFLTATRWTYDQTRSFMLYRATQIFKTPFGLDESNRIVFELLCRYFSEDPEFISMASNLGIINPSLSKGILLAGVMGVGKSWLMQLFQKNQRQVFFVYNAKQIAKDYQSGGADAALQYENKVKNAINDSSLFYHTYSGLCIDDLGTEDVKKHFGNHSNVIGDLIELRYAKGNAGVFLHATTNLTVDQIEEYYGGRVRSRMREVFNFIELPGNDRRK